MSQQQILSCPDSGEKQLVMYTFDDEKMEASLCIDCINWLENSIHGKIISKGEDNQ